MKTYLEFLSEANPYRDSKIRKEGERLFDLVFKGIKSRSIYRNLRTTTDTIYFDMGEELDLPEYRNLHLHFTYSNSRFAGAFKRDNLLSHIWLAMIDPDADISKMFVGDMRKAILAGLPMHGFNEVKRVFVHEFIHYLDYKRFKDPSYGNTGQSSKITTKDYYNDPRELNAHTQDKILYVERQVFMWMGDEALEILKKRASLITNRDDDSLVHLSKFYQYFKKIEQINDFGFYWENFFERSSEKFVTSLTPDNLKKVKVRVWQYHEHILKRKIVKYEKTAERIFRDDVHNLDIISYFAQIEPEEFREFRRRKLV